MASDLALFVTAVDDLTDKINTFDLFIDPPSLKIL